MSDLFMRTLIGIAIYICVYAIVDRICRCKEQSEAFRAYGLYFTAMGNKSEGVNLEGILKTLKKTTEDK